MANIELDGANKKIKVDSGDLTLDVPGDIILDADGGDVVFADGGTNLLKVTNSSSDVVLQPQVDAKDIIFKQYDGTTVATVEDNGTFNIPTDKLAINGTAVTSTAAELNILDGVTATATEINLIDGGTARGTTAIADGDGVLINDAGTMRMTNVTTLKTYMAGETNTPGWLATMTGVQSISDNTYTTVQFNTESDGYDTDSGFNTGTYTYTVPSGEGGKYFLTAGVYIHANSNRPYGIKFVTSAGDRGEVFISGINHDTGVVPATTTIQSLNAGQTVYVQVYQNSTASKNTSYGIKNCWFGGFKISS